VPLVDQILFECADRLPDQARYQPLGRKDILRRIGLRGLDPALFERPKSGFSLPFNRWIRRGLKKAMDQILRDPQAAVTVGLDPAAVERLWQNFLDGAPGLYWSRIWSVYVLIRWCHRNRVFV
jgi:asparagine synthase (glutamine-hydrolysing)